MHCHAAHAAAAPADAVLSPACAPARTHLRSGRPTDVYALGACLFTFVYGRIPFNAPNVYKLFQVCACVRASVRVM